MRQRGDRQPQAERRVARHQEQIAAPQLPALAAPARRMRARIAFQRWIGSTKPLGASRPWSNTRAMRARSSGIGEFGIGGIDIGRQRRFLLQPVRGILVGRQHIVAGRAPRRLARAFGQALGIGDVGLARILDARDQVGILPDRHAVLAPIEPEGPARQAFARDTICPARNAAGRPAQSACAAGGSDRRRARAWSGRPPRCSIPATPSRRSTRRSARRPW